VNFYIFNTKNIIINSPWVNIIKKFCQNFFEHMKVYYTCLSTFRPLGLRGTRLYTCLGWDLIGHAIKVGKIWLSLDEG